MCSTRHTPPITGYNHMSHSISRYIQLSSNISCATYEMTDSQLRTLALNVLTRACYQTNLPHSFPDDTFSVHLNPSIADGEYLTLTVASATVLAHRLLSKAI